jgi:hypothetical protein
MQIWGYEEGSGIGLIDVLSLNVNANPFRRDPQPTYPVSWPGLKPRTSRNKIKEFTAVPTRSMNVGAISEFGSVGQMRAGWERQEHSRMEPVPLPLRPPQTPKWPYLGSNPGRHSRTQATDTVSFGTLLKDGDFNPYTGSLPHSMPAGRIIYSETCIRRNLNKEEICSMWTNSIVPARRISVIYFV